jgi:uncharacterized membrane protein
MPFIESVPWLRALIGFVLFFFLPGFAWTLVFFDRKKINYVERIALSLGLSIALITLSVIALNVVFDLRIDGSNALVTILVITIIPLGIYLVRKYWIRRTETSDGD